MLRKLLFTKLLLTCVLALSAHAQVVISQVYGGGGNAGATLTHDFIELFNRGAAPVSLDGWSVQYASATGVNWQRTNLSGTIAAGGYYLIQQAQGAGGTTPLPTPDASGAIPMAATAGKVALISNQTTIASGTSCPIGGAGVEDFVGFGTANCFEGAGSTPALNNTTAAIRAGAGCTDTNNNSADFSTGIPTPRNSASPPAICIQQLNITSASPLPSAFALNPYSTTLQAAGGTPPYTFSWTGATPPGLALSPAGVISGTPTATGVFSFTVTVADFFTAQVSKPFDLTVATPTCSPTLSIPQIQGSGPRTPVPPATPVTTRGLVTGISSNGFFIQDPVGDGNPQTSDGLFVFTGSGRVPDNAQVGADVCVSGAVIEFPDDAPASLTEIAAAGPVQVSVVALSNGNPLPPHATIAAADTDPAQLNNLERYEGMRVQIPQLTVVAPTRSQRNEATATSSSGGTFFGVVAGVNRPFREPGALIFDPLPVTAPCCIPIFDSNPERIRVPTFVLPSSTPIDVAAGATISNLTGILDYNSRTYSLLPDNSVPPTVSNPAVATPVSAPAASEATVAAFNLERFYDTVDDPGVSDVALTPEAFSRRLAKASLAIRNVLRTPDILAVVEMENLSTLQTLAARINADALAAGQTPPDYAAYLEEGNDIGGIDVGFLVKTNGRIRVESVTQLGKTTTFINPATGASELLNDRPPLVLRATLTHPGSLTSLPLTVIANHLRSLSDAASTAAAGIRVRAKRNAQAEFLARYVQELQTFNPQEKIVLAGDFNAFEFSDGLVDVIGAIKGTPAASSQVLLPSAAITSPPLTNLVDTVPAANRYSYSFDGSAQVLDHILVNDAALAYVTRIEFARSNADFPDILRNDATRPERISDHDAPVAYFRLPVTRDITRLVNVLVLGNLNNPVFTEAEGDIRIVNQSGEFISGPVHLLLSNLPTGVAVVNPDGYLDGVPYFRITQDGLAPGASRPVRVRITKPRGVRFDFTPRLLNGRL